jgi:hypothetical protein
MRIAAVLFLWFTALVGVFAWPWLTGSPNLGDDLTRHTVWVALAYYAVAAWLMFGPLPETVHGRLTRWCWTLAWVAFVIHVGVAFHFYHHWSHTSAVDHVRERSGVGEGVFASYLFTIMWSADVAWWWLRPRGYAARPIWVTWSLHGFMLMMVFAATVVYEEGPIRWLGLLLCVVLISRIATRCLGAPLNYEPKSAHTITSPPR